MSAKKTLDAGHGIEGNEHNHREEGRRFMDKRTAQGRGHHQPVEDNDQAGHPSRGTDGRPRPVSLLGPRLLHDLVRNGYRITTVCVACGAPLTSPQSVARQLGPVCGKRAAA